MLRQNIPLKKRKEPSDFGRLFAFLFHVEHSRMRFAEYTHFLAEDTILAVPKIFFGISP